MIFNILKGYFKGLGVRGVINWVFFIILIFVAVRACQKENQYKERISELTKTKIGPVTPAIQKATELSRESDKEGRERVVYRLSEPIIKKITDNEKLDSIAAIANVRAERINAVSSINGSLTKENTELKRYINTLEDGRLDTVFQYSDPWFSTQGYRKSDTTFILKNIIADASVNKIDHTNKKYWLFGRNESLSTVYYNSPYVRVNGLQTMTVKKKEPFWDVDLNVEGKYLHSQKEVLIGPKIRLGVGRLGLSGGYYINPAGQIGNGLWYGADWKIY